MYARLCMVMLAAAIMAMPVLMTGCEESHQESTKSNLLGGQTHEDTTVYKNPVTGDTSVQHEKEVTH